MCNDNGDAAGSACSDPVPCASPDRGQSSVGNGCGAGVTKPLQGLDRVVEGCRARFRHTDVACRGRKGQGACRIGVCKTLVHTRLFVDAKILFFSANTKNCWRFRSTLRVSRNDVPHTGQKREKMGGGDDVSGNGAHFPAAHLFPFPHPTAHVIPPPTSGGGGTPTLQESILHERHRISVPRVCYD